ncbi:hypothetical protein [Leucobacter denitrificans]|uniref:Uncharacterized protein n=1 Tax=Leucobacter denitrificans TaxID=683042 RepID=A0A7G9S798_9MICO|nr:hypothetical protein [Leucobacter denitrificans]QNN63723.1 hypothetical protein H9L06_05400 [Leucobacter denitrificans]
MARSPTRRSSGFTDELQGFVDTGDTVAALDLAAQIFGARRASRFVGALQAGVISMDELKGAHGTIGDTILGVCEEMMGLLRLWLSPRPLRS